MNTTPPQYYIPLTSSINSTLIDQTFSATIQAQEDAIQQKKGIRLYKDYHPHSEEVTHLEKNLNTGIVSLSIKS